MSLAGLSLAIGALAVVLGACSGAPPSSGAINTSTPAPSVGPTVPAPSEATVRGTFEVDGGLVYLECSGTGSPTVVLEAGLGGTSSQFVNVFHDLAETTRTCRYDRPGLGQSHPHSGVDSVAAGQRAESLHALLDVADVGGPFVLVGFSYGGMIIRTFASRFPTETAGLLFIDASHEEQFNPDSWWATVDGQPWQDGAHRVDKEATRAELVGITDVGDTPVIVLTHGQMNGEFERFWSRVQDALAGMSSNSLHMVATESDHDIISARTKLVLETARTLVSAARADATLPACGPTFEALGAECLDGTMGDLIARWDAQRAAFVADAGDVPAGRYTFSEDNVTFEITIADGHLDLGLDHPDGTEEELSADYAASGDTITFLWPFDWRIGRTPGINSATWSVGPDGTLHFIQTDDEAAESWLAAPWVRLGD